MKHPQILVRPALALVLVIGVFAIVRGIVFLVDAFRGPEIGEFRLSP